MSRPVPKKRRSPFREWLYVTIFEHDTAAGRAFDVILFWCIILSVLAVMLESVASIRLRFGAELRFFEWVFTALFTVEYVLRLYCARRPLRYSRSFFGLVDLLAVIPTYLSLYLSGTQSLLVIRALRLLRVFRVLKLSEYQGEAHVLLAAIRASRKKITVFLGAVLTIVAIMGSTMYLVEGGEHGFTSIPQGMYWAIVTMTTVGYGDIAPKTPAGQFIAAILMILGYGIIAVPTGIVTAELAHFSSRPAVRQPCPSCLRLDHDADARHCKYCGAKLE